MEKNVPAYFCGMLEDYLKNRKLIYYGQGTHVEIPLINGVLQGSILRPTLWNILYDGLLRFFMSKGIEIIAFADDMAHVAKSTVIFMVKDLLEKAMETTLK